MGFSEFGCLVQRTPGLFNQSPRAQQTFLNFLCKVEVLYISPKMKVVSTHVKIAHVQQLAAHIFKFQGCSVSSGSIPRSTGTNMSESQSTDLYGYLPSKPAALFGIAYFGTAALASIIQIICGKWRHYWLITIVLAAAGEGIGWGGRFWAHNEAGSIKLSL